MTSLRLLFIPSNQSTSTQRSRIGSFSSPWPRRTLQSPKILIIVIGPSSHRRSWKQSTSSVKSSRRRLHLHLSPSSTIRNVSAQLFIKSSSLFSVTERPAINPISTSSSYAFSVTPRSRTRDGCRLSRSPSSSLHYSSLSRASCGPQAASRARTIRRRGSERIGRQ